MTVREMIAELQRLAADPTSGITMDSPVHSEHPDAGMSEAARSLYVHVLGYKNHPDHDRAVVMVSGLTREVIAELAARR